VLCFFATDLHGQLARYERLAERMRAERPDALFLGGDLLDHGMRGGTGAAFLEDYLDPLLADAGGTCENVFLILGNDDPRSVEDELVGGERRGRWTYVHDRAVAWRGYDVFGYACVPPTPFRLKDWERYDVSRHVDPGCVSPEEGARSVQADAHDIRYATIARDLDRLAGTRDLARGIFLFHTPPYDTVLDRAALDGRMIDHVPLDVHVGSIAVRRFIERRQPLVTLHGHVHESARITGQWRARSGRTTMFGAAHDGPELALVRFDPETPEGATRELIPVR
jgi:Icc-related predicted phosphoesterase